VILDACQTPTCDAIKALLSKLDSMASEGGQASLADPYYVPFHQACKANLNAFYERASYADVHSLFSYVFYDLRWFDPNVNFRAIERKMEEVTARKILAARTHRDFFLTVRRYLWDAFQKWPQQYTSRLETSLVRFNNVGKTTN
jgi:hypothetical protein